MTLKTICQDALNEIGAFEVPDSYAGSNLPTSKLCLALANRAGRSLERAYRFDSLVTEHTFTTVADQADYTLPTDFRAFANMSAWDRTNDRPLIGGVAPSHWQWFQSSGNATSITKYFRVRGTTFSVWPTPATTDDLAFEYYSAQWVMPTAGANKEVFTLDTDTPRMDEQLLTLDLKWRFLASKGFPAEVEYKEYTNHLLALLADQNGMIDLHMGAVPEGFSNLPETGFGA